MTRLEELLDIIPETIEKPIIVVEWENDKPVKKLSDYNHTYKLRIEKKDDKFESFYVFTGFEGEIQILPIFEEELQQISEYGGICEYTDRSKSTLEESLEDLLCWLRKDGHVIK